MSGHRWFFAAVLAVSLPVVGFGQTESEFYATPKTPSDFWRAARFEIRLGNYERAAERIKGLLDLNPDAKQLFDLVDRPGGGSEGGMAPFLRLRNVPRWYSFDAADKADRRDKEAKASVETLIDRLSKALETELSNPDRIRRFAGALAGPPEESAFALREIRRSGKAAAPVLAQLLAEGPQAEVRSGVITAVPELESVVVAPLLAYLAGADANAQADLIDALRRRADYRNQTLNADSDPVPTLWYLWGNPKTTPTVKARAREGIISATRVDPEAADRGGAQKTAQAELTAAARRFYLNTANLPVLPGDDTGGAVHAVWTWDGKALKETKLSRAAAAEFYGLRYAKWALELQPDLAAAQTVFLGLAIETHALRAGGAGNLATTAPDLHAALATAPFDLLATLLEDALREKKTAVVLAVTRVIGDRTETQAARATTRPSAKDMRPSLLVKALDYPDARVQFAAADALLRTPGTPTHGRAAQIVKILAGAVAAEPAAGDKQKALLVDPDRLRAESVAALLRRVGFDVEHVRTGRDVFRRLHEKSDIDLVLLDRHVPDPMVNDLLPQLRSDRRGRGLPVLVIASPDGITPVNVFTALARLAVVVSFADLPLNPYIDYSLGRKDLVERVDRTAEDTRRDILTRHKAQVRRMTELAEEAGFIASGETADRIAYLSIQTFSPEVLYAFVRQLLDEERILLDRLLPDAIREEVAGAPAAALKSRIRADGPPSPEAAERTVSLMKATNRMESGVPVERLPAMNKTWDLFWNPDAPKLPPVEAVRNPEIENRLARIVAPFPNVRVIPAVFTDDGFRAAVAQAADAKAPLGTPAEKKETARTALVWLRKMAVGELPGYSFVEASAAIRGALRSDDLAGLAIDAVVRLPSREAQQDLANLAVDGSRPVPLRTQAADALVQHLQTFGKFVTGPQAAAVAAAAGTVEEPALRARLLAAQGVLKSDLKGTADRLKGYVPKEAPPKEAPPKEEPKEEKKD